MQYVWVIRIFVGLGVRPLPENFIAFYLARGVVSLSDTRLGRSLGWIK